MAATLADPLLINTKLVSDLVSPGGYNVARLCGLLHLKASEFAELTQRETESVARTVKKDDFIQLVHAETRQRVRELVEIAGLLRAMELDASTWIRTPLPSYAGKTPFELVAEGRGRELITRLLGLAVGDVGG
jgi:hypothetical protein